MPVHASYVNELSNYIKANIKQYEHYKICPVPLPQTLDPHVMSYETQELGVGCTS